MTVTEIAAVAATVIASVGGGGAMVFGLSGFLGRIWADRAVEKLRAENARDLEKDRQEYARLNVELTHQLAIVTERAKTALQMGAVEHQIRFVRLYEKRAEAIEKLDHLADEIEALAKLYVYDGVKSENEPETYAQLEKKLGELQRCRESQRLYLSDEVSNFISSFLATVSQPLSGFRIYSKCSAPDEAIQRYHTEKVIEAANAINEHVPAVRTRLIREFRPFLDWK